MSWSEAIAAYTTALQAAGRSPGTIRLHRHYLRRVAGCVRSPWTATTAQLMGALAVEGWSAEARKSARGTLVSFYKWAAVVGHRHTDPTAGLPSIKVPPGVPRPCPDDALADALAGADTRIRHMLRLGALAGLRCCEIARVHADDLVDGVLFVIGKGGRSRVVPILDPELHDAIAGAGGYLFPGKTDGHLSAGHVSKLLSRALPGVWTGHKLRHRFGTRGFAGTRDLLAMCALMGHSRPETTARYVLTPDEALRAAVAAAA